MDIFDGRQIALACQIKALHQFYKNVPKTRILENIIGKMKSTEMVGIIQLDEIEVKSSESLVPCILKPRLRFHCYG